METKNKNPETMSNSELFHFLWTKSAYMEDYDKKEWRELRKRLDKVGFLETKVENKIIHARYIRGSTGVAYFLL